MSTKRGLDGPVSNQSRLNRDQKNITASFSRGKPLCINGTLKYFSSQEAIMLTDLPQGGKF